MMWLALVLIVGGIISMAYGNNLNNDLSAQLESLFSSGSRNPGDVFFYLGIAVIVVGGVLLVRAFMKKKSE